MLVTPKQWKFQNEIQPSCKKFTQSKLSFSALKPKDSNIQLSVPTAIPVKRKAGVFEDDLVSICNPLTQRTHLVVDENDARLLFTKPKRSLSVAQRGQKQIATSEIKVNGAYEGEPAKKKRASLSNSILANKQKTANGSYTGKWEVLSNNDSLPKADMSTQSVKTSKHSTSNQSLLKSSSKLKSAKPIKLIIPPVFHAIDIHLTEDDLLQRIQLRELLFRFCSVLNIEKHIMKLDNPQYTRVNDVSYIVVQNLLRILSQKETDPKETLVNKDAAERLNNELKKSKIINNKSWASLSDLLKSRGLDGIPEGTVTRCRGNSRNFSEDERIKLISLLANCALHSHQFRESLNIPIGTIQIRKENLRKETRKMKLDEINDNNKRIQLTSVVHKMRARKSLSKIRKAEEELDKFEVEMRKKANILTQLKVELMRDEENLRKRTKPLGSDVRGNQYWKFSDLSQGATKSLKADGWSQCIIVCGVGVIHEDSEVTETNSSKKRWWAVRGHENVEQLRKWLKHEYSMNFEQPNPKQNIHVGQNPTNSTLSIDTIEKTNANIGDEDRIIQENLLRLIECLGDYVVWFKALETRSSNDLAEEEVI